MTKKTLIIVPQHNARGKRDVTGAFLPEAIRLSKLHSESDIITFDNTKPAHMRRAEVVSKASASAMNGGKFQDVAIFCHGWATGIQTGHTNKTVDRLAAAIRFVAPSEAVRVALFCCSTGDDPDDDFSEASGTEVCSRGDVLPGEGSFADRLRDALCVFGATHCLVTAHSTRGHTTKNPYVLRFMGVGSKLGGVGGIAIVPRRSKLWGKWCKALKTTDLRLRLPFMSVADIYRELEA